MLALAAVVNTPEPAATSLPTPSGAAPVRIQQDITAAGDTLEEVTLWDGRKLTVSKESNFALAPEAKPTTTPHEIRLAAKTAARKVYIFAESEVRAYFADIPIMIEIAKCESRFRHYDTQGGVLRGEVNSADRGVMQINEYYHGATAKTMSLNLLSLEDNLTYARYLYETQGTTPWSSSSACWGGYSSQIAQN